QACRLQQAITPDTQPACIVYPSTPEMLAAVVGCAHHQGWPLAIMGSGSKLTWGGLRSGIQVAVSTIRLNRLVDHAVGDMTVTVEAGMPLSTLQPILAQAGQWLPVDPLYGEQASVGGTIATAATGSLRHRYGGIRDLVLGITIVRCDGQLAKAGGRVVKNVAGYDLMKLFTGSYGTLGIISQATFRVYPLPEASQTVLLVGDADSVAQASRTVVGSALTPIAVDLLSADLAKSLGLGTDIGLAVRFQGFSASVTEQSDRVSAVADTLGLTHQILSNQADQQWWQQRQQAMAQTTPPTLLCKVGIRSTEAVSLLRQVAALPASRAVIHAASGTGWLRLAESVAIADIMAIRAYCQAAGGYLSILEAPIALKQDCDLWGYHGNALDLMRRLKYQFDPSNLLNPGCFVGGI
ncbi:MAG: FAD-binding oxidoreductase, partial [Cyanobacteria bacterium]|nr:FAD-binding oxidoreductase [Cyanobacteriota bacterium]MDW8203317.1 FAD-binding oxidoreductase [Cyanobacteriota bacterium SKYGB_h_bin112]